ncbi:hypothetical protein JCM24511_00678 [Saitozyma sp. JCM 24511]|nr:hypothetical protein JCM24511_00678 [Saitozyma sp. JCM 24511]
MSLSMKPTQVEIQAVRGKVFVFEEAHKHNRVGAMEMERLAGVIKSGGGTVLSESDTSGSGTAQPHTHFRIVAGPLPPADSQLQRHPGWTYFNRWQLGGHLSNCHCQLAIHKALLLNIPPILPLSDRDMRWTIGKHTPINLLLHRVSTKIALADLEFGRRGFPAWLFHSGLVDVHDPVFGPQPNFLPERLRQQAAKQRADEQQRAAKKRAAEKRTAKKRAAKRRRAAKQRAAEA